MIKQNLHTHSVYCDGNDTLEEMVLTAIEKKFNVLGFSGHGYEVADDCRMTLQDTEKYKAEVNELKEKYKNQINIFLGVEQDESYRLDKINDFDYVIGSKHYFKYGENWKSVDYYPEMTDSIINDWYKGDLEKMSNDYYSDIEKMADYDEVNIIGHLDVITKFNKNERLFKFDDPVYLKYAYKCIDRLVQSNKIFEVNTGAMAKGYRDEPYPYINLLEYIHNRGGKLVLSSDCHNKMLLDAGFDYSLKLIEKVGFKNLQLLTHNGFISVPINEFK